MLKSWRRFKNYVKHDLREIVSPSSLEHPPGEGPPEETWGDIWKVNGKKGGLCLSNVRQFVNF